MDAVYEIVLILLSFFSGSLPFAVIIAKTFKGIDPRKEGSKNPGTTNVARLCGVPCGIITLVMDILKGTIPVYISVVLFPDTPYCWLQSVCALAAVSGHIKSPFLNFHGGKGVATGIGVLIPLALPPLIIGIIICICIILISGYVSLGALIMYSLLPTIYYFTDNAQWIPFSLCMIVIVFTTHKTNIQRLLQGTEKSWRKNKNT